MRKYIIIMSFEIEAKDESELKNKIPDLNLDDARLEKILEINEDLQHQVDN